MLLSVYGSLRKGLGLHGALKGNKHRFVGYGWVANANLYNLGSFPCVHIVDDATRRVRVEVYDVGDNIGNFDRIEGYNPKNQPKHNHYQRVNVTVTMDDGSTVETAIYTWTAERLKTRYDQSPAIGHGDWTVFEIARNHVYDPRELDGSYAQMWEASRSNESMLAGMLVGDDDDDEEDYNDDDYDDSDD